jgi:ankyrin repeat protein
MKYNEEFDDDIDEEEIPCLEDNKTLDKKLIEMDQKITKLCCLIEKNELDQIKKIKLNYNIINHKSKYSGIHYYKSNNLSIHNNGEHFMNKSGYYLDNYMDFNLNYYSIRTYTGIPNGLCNYLDYNDDGLKHYFGFGKNNNYESYLEWNEKFGKKKKGDCIEWSCLNYCIAFKRNEILIYLLSFGGNPEIKDELNENSYDFAKFIGNKEIINTLDKYFIQKNMNFNFNIFDIIIIYNKNLF